MRIRVLVWAMLLGWLWPGVVGAVGSPEEYFDYNPYSGSQVLGEKDYREFGGYFLIFTRDLTPDSPLYFLKRMEEGVGLVTAMGNPMKRAETLLAIGGQRMKELDRVAVEGRVGVVRALAKAYDRTMADQAKTLEKLKDKSEAVGILLETDKEVAKHLLTLEEVSLKVPEAAEAQVHTALVKAEEVVDRVADASGRPAVPREMVSRLQSYKAQGLLSEEEIGKIISARSRKEARDEFRKLAENRIVPLADVKKFDEAAAAYYPDGYAKAVELRKFKELASLEKERPDEATVQAMQEFAKSYKPGDVVPPTIRGWWAPMVRLEELQATFRPDLLEETADFKYRPEEQQKYTELVERMKPTGKDMQYVREMVAKDPAAAADPALGRVLVMGERFGTADQAPVVSPAAKSCSRDAHWVNVLFMPGGGYCVPDLVYQPLSLGTAGGELPCPPNYHRAAAGGACYPDNPAGPGMVSYLPAAGSCPAGYEWKADKSSPRGGFCGPRYITGSGGYPSPVTPPIYCPSGKVFRDGKCEDYNPPPAEGCPERSRWNGQKCVEQKNCGEGCRWAEIGNACECPSGGSGTPSREVRDSGSSGSYNPEEMCRRAPNCTWIDSRNSCECGGAGPGASAPPQGTGGPQVCGSGYYWNGSVCARNESQPAPMPVNNPPPTGSPFVPPPPPPPPPPADNPPSVPPPPVQ